MPISELHQMAEDNEITARQMEIYGHQVKTQN